MIIDFGQFLRGDFTGADYVGSNVRTENAKLLFDGHLYDTELRDDVVGVRAVYSGEAEAVRGEKEEIHLAMDINAEFKLVCSRCAREFSKNRRIKTVLRLKNGGYEAVNQDTAVAEVLREADKFSEDILFLENAKCDISELVRELIITEMPMRFVCDDECKGLCPKCGADLNEGECGCPKREIDPRLAKLQDYFKNENHTGEEVE